MVNREVGMVKYLGIEESIKSFLGVIYLIFIIYICYQIFLAISGGTWSTENIIVAGIGIIITGMFAILGFQVNQSKTLGKIEERTRFLEENIREIKKEILRLKKEI